MKIPTQQYCREMFEIYAVPITIRKHLEKVRDVGEMLSYGMKGSGVPIDVDLVDSGCLLHDVMKAASLPKLEANPDYGYDGPTERELEVWKMLRNKYAGIHETLVAADILSPAFPEFSEFIANIGSTGNPTYLDESLPNSTELKVVHYADWRVQFDKVIPFPQRLQYLKDTYLHRHKDKGDDWWKEAVKKEIELESSIFRHLNFGPDDISYMLEKK